MLHPFIDCLRTHPGLSSANHELIAEAEAHPVYCLASLAFLQRYYHAPRAHAHQWNVYGSNIGFRQRRALLCRGAQCTLLVHRLIRFQGQYGARNMLHYVCWIISRRHFLVSKNAPETLFQEGNRLYEEQRYREAAKNWAQAALLQHAPSHALLSNLLINGRGDVPKDEQRAFEFASCGAALECAHSKGALGFCYLFGHGVIQNEARGFALGRESAAVGSSFGLYVIGICYFKGIVVSKDKIEAGKWFFLAAEKKHENSQLQLGVMFQSGQGVTHNYTEAMQWYLLAATQGNAEAQISLGEMFACGFGVAQDNAEAVRWYRLAAAQGVANGQYLLGTMFEYGKGVAQDDAEAKKWYDLAQGRHTFVDV
jgi:TPR repeat protein